MHPADETLDESCSQTHIENNPSTNDANVIPSEHQPQKPANSGAITSKTQENATEAKNAHLTDAERKLVLLIESNIDGKPATATGDTNEQLAIELVESGQILDVNFCDDTCTTPLQHAAFRGRQRLVRVLLERGADVNDDRQTQGYTALMFGALSGRPGVCQLLLEYGARASYINRVGKTASQLAAFCGQHACAAAINNFISRDMIEYYTEPHGLETEPLLSPASLVTPLHRLVIQTNLHPVHLLNVMMATRQHDADLPLLLVPAHSRRAVRVLKKMLEKQMKGTAERSMSINECSALKFHFLASFLDYIREEHERHRSEGGENGKQKLAVSQQIALLQQHFLKGSPPYGFCGVIDQFICELFRKFPYPTQSPLLLQLVRQITQALRNGSMEDGTSQQQQSTTSIVLVQFLTTINGQRYFADEDDNCAACGLLAPSNRKCSSCKMLAYCNAQCQKLHWFSHKKFCSTLQQERAAMQARARKFEEEKKAAEAAEKEKQRQQKEEEEMAKKQRALAGEQEPVEAPQAVSALPTEQPGGSQRQVDVDAPAHVAEIVDAASVEASILEPTDLHKSIVDVQPDEGFQVDDDDDKQPLII